MTCKNTEIHICTNQPNIGLSLCIYCISECHFTSFWQNLVFTCLSRCPAPSQWWWRSGKWRGRWRWRTCRPWRRSGGGEGPASPLSRPLHTASGDMTAGGGECVWTQRVRFRAAAVTFLFTEYSIIKHDRLGWNCVIRMWMNALCIEYVYYWLKSRTKRWNWNPSRNGARFSLFILAQIYEGHRFVENKEVWGFSIILRPRQN